MRLMMEIANAPGGFEARGYDVGPVGSVGRLELGPR